MNQARITASGMIGRRFGRLTVASSVESHKKYSSWNCQCDCGESKVVIGFKLTSGSTRSCGCLRSETTIARNIRHGLGHTPEYRTWSSMRARCGNPNYPDWKYYGGRGIKVCDRWLDFAVFYADMGQKPTATHSIDRIDNNGPYSPDNCRWATIQEQRRNRSNCICLTFNSETKCVSAWAETTGISAGLLRYRIQAGWSVADVLTRPVIKRTK